MRRRKMREVEGRAFLWLFAILALIALGVGASMRWLLRGDFSTWAAAYGGEGDECAHSIVQAPGGGFAVAGWTDSFGAGGSDLWVLRLDEKGNISPPYAEGFKVTDTKCEVTNTSGTVENTDCKVTNTDCRVTSADCRVTKAKVTGLAGREPPSRKERSLR